MVSFMVSAAAELPSYIFAGWAIDRCAGGARRAWSQTGKGQQAGEGRGMSTGEVLACAEVAPPRWPDCGRRCSGAPGTHTAAVVTGTSL